MRKFGYFLYFDVEDNFLQEAECLDKVDCCPILYDRYTNIKDRYWSLDLIFKKAKSGDLLIIRSLDQIALSIKQLSENIMKLQHQKLHLLVLEQETIDTQKYGKDNIYSFILGFCNIEFDFRSNSLLIEGHSFLDTKYYKVGWTREKIETAQACFVMYNAGITITSICSIKSLTFATVKKYINLCKTGKIKIIESQVIKKENSITRRKK